MILGLKIQERKLGKGQMSNFKITALIAILTSISTTALDQQLHTAHFINDMHRILATYCR